LVGTLADGFGVVLVVEGFGAGLNDGFGVVMVVEGFAAVVVEGFGAVLVVEGFGVLAGFGAVSVAGFGAGFGAVSVAGFGAVPVAGFVDTGAGVDAEALATPSMGRGVLDELGIFGGLGKLAPTFFILSVVLSVRAATGGGALGRAGPEGGDGMTERPRRAGGFRGSPGAGTGDFGGAGSVAAVGDADAPGRGGGPPRLPGSGGGMLGRDDAAPAPSGGISISGSVASPSSSSWISCVGSSRSLPMRAPPYPIAGPRRNRGDIDAGPASPEESPRGVMIVQDFGFTADFGEASNTVRIVAKPKYAVGPRAWARAGRLVTNPG